MKRVRMMITAIALFAVVGGALAFKAEDNYNFNLYTGSSSSSCPNFVQGITTTTTSTSPSIYVTFETGSTSSCIQTYTIANQ